MSVRLPGPPYWSGSKVKYLPSARSSVMGRVEFAPHRERPPERRMITESCPEIRRHQLAIFNESVQIRGGQRTELMIRMKLPKEVRIALGNIGMAVLDDPEIELVTHLAHTVTNDSLERRWIRGHIAPSPYVSAEEIFNFYSTDEDPPIDFSKPRVFVNYNRAPVTESFSFQLVTTMAYYYAKVTVLPLLQGRQVADSGSLSRLFGFSVELRVGKNLAETGFHNYFGSIPFSPEHPEVREWIERTQRQLALFAAHVPRNLIEQAFEVQGSLEHPSFDDPLILSPRVESRG